MLSTDLFATLQMLCFCINYPWKNSFACHTVFENCTETLIRYLDIVKEYQKLLLKKFLKYLRKRRKFTHSYVIIFWSAYTILKTSYQSLRKKCAYSELFWSAFSRVRTEYGEIQAKCGKMRTRITPNTDIFQAVYRFTEISAYLFYKKLIVALLSLRICR